MPTAYAPLPLLRFAGDVPASIELDEVTSLIPENSRALQGVAQRVASPEEMSSLSRKLSWIVRKIEGAESADSQPHDEAAITIVGRAVLGVQITVPRGGPNLAWVEYEGQTGPFSRSVARGGRFVEPTWTRLYRLSETDVAELPRVVQGVNWAYGTASRLRSALAALEHGLISSDPLIRVLLFTTGLDAIVRAFKRGVFESRLNSFFGSNMLVFPRFGNLQRLPRYTVSDVAGDIYDLRNLVAHGQILQKRFMDRSDFEDVDGGASIGTAGAEEWRYCDILSDAACTLLCRGIRKILLAEDLRQIFDSDKAWRAHLSG